MKRLIYITFNIVFLTSILQGQVRYNIGDTLNVWASSGLNLRLTKESNSKILTNIPYGEKIIILDNSTDEETKVRMKVSCFIENKKTPEFNLTGRMIKVEYNKSEGFVFDGFLSKFQTFSNEEPIEDYLNKNSEILEIFDHEKNTYSRQNVYSNGINSFSFSPTSGCQENSYVIPEISFQEGFLIVYHILRLNRDELKNENCSWYISEIRNNHVKIRGMSEIDFSGSITNFGNFTVITIGMYN